MTPRPDRAALVARYPFPIDRFQEEAFDALDRGEHVVVAVPTGSGKTVVAEYGVAASLSDGKRAFYTAPIKALSNQKYRDLVEFHGEHNVGLLTGDNSINRDAPIVVMTTEVLRNMIYGRSKVLDDLGLVVLDEVHFLQDAYRGPVWEEVMIHLPQHVRLVCLSATVSNVDELADWITTIRGKTASIVERRRPVRLDNQYLVADRSNDRLQMLPVFIDGQANRDAIRLDESGSRKRGGRREAGGTHRGKHAHSSGRRRLAPPGRVEAVELLRSQSLLPAIFFIFSRAQCDAAAKSCVDAGLRLISDTDRDKIAAIVGARLGGLEEADLAVLGYQQFVAQLECGVAAHHAGMVPPMKEVVEACFIEGLIKVVFATETLAVGINMPARSVVIEKLTKFTGEGHERLTPGQYTQLTGRAGRRGIDDLGTAVVLWSPWVRFSDVAELAGSASFHLRSAFRPTYNMAANLIRTYSSSEAHHLLNLSFAQYQADRDVVRLEARLERRRAVLAELREESASEFGDINEYRSQRKEERQHRSERRRDRFEAIDDTLAELSPGDVLPISVGKYRGAAALIASAHRKNGIRLTLITKSAKLLYAAAEDFHDAPQPVGKISLPRALAPNRKDYRNEVAYRLRKTKLAPAESGGHKNSERSSSEAHPILRDPDLKAKLNAAGQAERVAREVEDIRERVAGKNQSLAQDFDRVLDVLSKYGYIDLEAWTLTQAGEVLARTFHESDLLLAEIIQRGLLDDLSPADVASLASGLVYEHRSKEPPPTPWFSSAEIGQRWRRIAATSEDLAAQERSVGLVEHRAPDPTFSAIAYAWVAGEGFAEVVGEEEVTGGDFVRTMKQLIDVLRQLAVIAPQEATRRAAGDAAAAAYRGVVADSSAPTAVDRDDDD
ncbi:MAG: DEAD/DEAH box helicase [Ilumatobacteraceae bacterium]|nr:DEAD/DEAH box helicase [Ilumatobacteraceae bacterium]